MAFGKKPVKKQGLKTGFFDGIQSARARKKTAILKDPGIYRCEILEMKYFISQNPTKRNEPIFVIELKVLDVGAGNEDCKDRTFSIVQTEGKFADAFMGFMNMAVAAAMKVPEEDVTSELAEQAITMADEDNEERKGEAIGNVIIVEVSENWKRNKQTGESELSDFPNYTLSADDGE